MSGTAKGLILAIVNVAVVSLGFFTTMEGHERVEIAALVFWFGLFPGLLVGLACGRIAESSLKRFRLVAIASVALVAVVLLGMLAFTMDLGEEPTFSATRIAFALIPTLASACILERWTRVAPPLPAAAVR